VEDPEQLKEKVNTIRLPDAGDAVASSQAAQESGHQDRSDKNSDSVGDQQRDETPAAHHDSGDKGQTAAEAAKSDSNDAQQQSADAHDNNSNQ
jgi:hypothetical protein